MIFNFKCNFNLNLKSLKFSLLVNNEENQHFDKMRNHNIFEQKGRRYKFINHHWRKSILNEYLHNVL